jgi:hypothetical protein
MRVQELFVGGAFLPRTRTASPQARTAARHRSSFISTRPTTRPRWSSAHATAPSSTPSSMPSAPGRCACASEHARSGTCSHFGPFHRSCPRFHGQGLVPGLPNDDQSHAQTNVPVVSALPVDRFKVVTGAVRRLSRKSLPGNYWHHLAAPPIPGLCPKPWSECAA